LPFEEALLDGIEHARVVEFKGLVWRVTLASQNPLRANVRGARWNPPDISALYSSLSEHTARREFAYLIKSQPALPREGVKVHRLSVQLQRVVELDLPTLEGLGFRLSDVREGINGQLRSREIGGAVAFLGREGLEIPSLRDPGGTNLVIYADQIRVPNSAYDLVDSIEVELDAFLEAFEGETGAAASG